MLYIGIDPGQTGGIAVIQNHKVISVTPMILAGKFIDVIGTTFYFKEIMKFVDSPLRITACIEKVHSMPQQGVSSSFKFGRHTGTMYGIVGALGIPLFEVTPQKWKKVVLEGTAKDKAAAADFCSRVYPYISLLATERSRKPHTGIVDAICIARYASLETR